MRFLWLALVLCATAMLDAQTVSPPAAPKRESPTQEKKSRLQRWSTFVPPLSAASLTSPLRTKQKFGLFLYNTLNPYPLLVAAARAGVTQGIDSNHNYGQGAEGYAKRFGAAYADNASIQFFGMFFYPVLLRQDPRHFRKAAGTASARSWYAISRVFVTRNDSGNSAPNASFWLASATSAVLANTYYPPGNRSPGDAARRVGIAFGSQAGFNLVKEFWPDIRRKVFKK